MRLIAANAASIRARHARREGEYTEAFDPRIVGLTGSLQQIAAVEQAVAPAVRSHKTRAGDEDDILDHGTYLCVMDPQGKFVRGLDFDTPSDRIADTLCALHGAANEGNAALIDVWNQLGLPRNNLAYAAE